MWHVLICHWLLPMIYSTLSKQGSQVLPFLTVVASAHSFEMLMGGELGPVYTQFADQSATSGKARTVATEYVICMTRCTYSIHFQGGHKRPL